jgi:hypothetical protein
MSLIVIHGLCVDYSYLCLLFKNFHTCLCVQDSVGPDNIPGYDKVQDLALFLVRLHSQQRESLSGEQVDELTALWEGLSDYDKQPTTVQPRHRPSLDKGRFRATKSKSETTPGLESTTR